MLGSVIGGYFSEPFGRVPVLSRMKLFQHYPYAASGLLLCGTTILASAGVLLFVREVCNENPDFMNITDFRRTTGTGPSYFPWTRLNIPLSRITYRARSPRERYYEVESSCKSALRNSVSLLSCGLICIAETSQPRLRFRMSWLVCKCRFSRADAQY